MADNLRVQAAAAAREWEDEIDATENRPGTGVECFVAGYLLGHSAGFTAGARGYDKLVAAAEFYLKERACFGIGSRMGCCAGTHNEPARRCVHLSDDPNEYCFSGKFREALDFLAAHAGTGIATDGKGEEGKP
jgi:hypothetical protein